MINRLEKRKLVARTGVPDDRRERLSVAALQTMERLFEKLLGHG